MASGLVAASQDAPHSASVTPLLTDMYQFSMAYAYWRAGRAEDASVFDLYFRKAPFHGEFTVFAGLEECLRFVQTYRFSPAQIAFLRGAMPTADPAFFDYLSALDCSGVTIHGMAEGTVVFPREPLLRIEGPLGICQLLETTLLNLCNFASLITTNAARFRAVAGPRAKLYEFGLRRAQGPDGGMSASRYALIGGFDGTSNVAAAMEAECVPVGSHAHALVSAYASPDDLPISCRTLNGVNILEEALRVRKEMDFMGSNTGELAAFVSFATAFPTRFVALVDTYDTLGSGVPNFICVARAMAIAGGSAYGVRLDSGDLAYLSKETRRMLRAADVRFGAGSNLVACTILASNDINEHVLSSLGEQGHEIDSFGIGTHLVTCQAQPALGMVYKLVEILGRPCMKLSNEAAKITLPGAKEVFRLLGSEGTPLMDLVIRVGEARPMPGKRTLARHPFDETRRAYVTPSAVLPLLRVVWQGSKTGGGGGTNLRAPFPSVSALQTFVRAQLALLREDHLRPLNPTPYKVSVSPELFHFLHDLWMKEVPIRELT
jgi:nicotinate phosphoribosyltransferase